jgi:hypothetical protein
VTENGAPAPQRRERAGPRLDHQTGGFGSFLWKLVTVHCGQRVIGRVIELLPPKVHRSGARKPDTRTRFL